jgi:hypothetical protein
MSGFAKGRAVAEALPCLQVGALEAIRVKILVKGSPSQLDSVRVRQLF